MQIHDSAKAPDKAAVLIGSDAEQAVILGALPLVESIQGQGRLLLRRLVGRPPALTLSHTALNSLVTNIYYNPEYAAEAASADVLAEVNAYLGPHVADQPMA